MNLFNHCVLTASDQAQADAFSSLLARRIRHGLYPREISFHVYPDPPGRVGSGAGTLWALHRLYEEIGFDPLEDADRPDAPSVLILHAAGESRRLPIFAPEGKLFAPVPVPSSSTIPPVVLDLQLALYLRFPWAPGRVVVGSGDVIIDFDTDSLDDLPAPITGFSTPASLDQGSRHGVFRFDAELHHLEDYYQKQPADFLAENAMIEGTDACALDIGIVAMNPEYVGRCFGLARATLASGATVLDEIAAGRLRFGLYLEQLSASLRTVDREEYHRRLDGQSALERADRDLFYDYLHELPLGGHLARKCTFLHFGSLREYPLAAARLAESGLKPFYALFDSDELPPVRHGDAVLMNSHDTAVGSAGAGPAVVDGCDGARLQLAGGAIVSALSGDLPVELPAGFCADGRTTPRGAALAIYHESDSFRPAPLGEVRFCAALLTEWLAARGLTPEDVLADGAGSTAAVDLYELELFALDPPTDLLSGYAVAPPDPAAWARRFRAAPRVSLRWLNGAVDVAARDERRAQLRARRLRDQLDAGRGWRTAPASDLIEAIESGADTQALARRADETVDPVLRLYRAATLRAAGVGAPEGHAPRSALRFISEGRWTVERRAVKPDQIVWARSPIRLDLGGGWTDTPPYTNLFGGAVTNVAVDLNGQPPIQAFVRPIDEAAIVFHSIDLGERERVDSAASLNAYGDPDARFALARAACVLLGLGEGELGERLSSCGGGFELSLLAAVPKGSGLGTSSIIGGVLLTALFRFFGFTYTPDDLFLSVLELEQMLTTGGGWQDQIGGLAGGVKYIETRPGSQAHPLVHRLDPYLFEEPEFKGRMTLYYTGVTRLAKNILQQVVDRVNRREPAFLFTHEYLRALARDARRSIALRDYEALTRVVRGSWRANRLIHESTTNDEIDALLRETSTEWDAVKLLGAGGGGYALFLSGSTEAADRLRHRLSSRSSSDRPERLVDFSLSRAGLQVSVS